MCVTGSRGEVLRILLFEWTLVYFLFGVAVCRDAEVLSLFESPGDPPSQRTQVLAYLLLVAYRRVPCTVRGCLLCTNLLDRRTGVDLRKSSVQ